MAFELADLPFAMKALEPHMSERTLQFHHGKHHAGYVKKLNALTEGSELADLPLEEVVRHSAKDGAQQAIFNNAAQVWNHDFFWNCMSPESNQPNGRLAERLKADFGDVDKFHEAFVAAAMGRFGSGWAWLVAGDGKLEVVTTANAGVPFTEDKTPLLTCDVWEHAYYLDYQNERERFVRVFLEHLVDWSAVGERLAKLAEAGRIAA
jgi:Fe-Mn family superoxide dismutase